MGIVKDVVKGYRAQRRADKTAHLAARSADKNRSECARCGAEFPANRERCHCGAHEGLARI